MKVRLKVQKGNVVLHEQDYDIADAESFGRACAHAWTELREQRLRRSSSIGALLEHLNDQLLDELDGACLCLAKA